jgi:DtxR family Mn-dependent transcriptional regulator
MIATRLLLVLYRIEQPATAPVARKTLARYLDRSTETITSALDHLEAEGLVRISESNRVALTVAGLAAAEDRSESYRSLSVLFETVIESESHESEALALAGVISPDVANWLVTTLALDASPPPAGGQPVQSLSGPDST